MPWLRSTVCFAAGVAVGALGREALPKLQEKIPQLKEQLGPVVAAAAAGARDAATDACAQVARQAAEVAGSVQDAMTRASEIHPESTGHSSSAA
jgi:hypothetical protein